MALLFESGTDRAAEREEWTLACKLCQRYGGPLTPTAPIATRLWETKSFIYVSVQEEIDERREFLKDMEALGQANKYRTIIETEISQVITDYMPVEDGSYYVMPSICLSVCLLPFRVRSISS